MFAKLSALVGGGPALNYNVDPEPYEVAWGCWTHFGGTSREDGSRVSVFRIAAADPNDLKLTAARNGVKRLRMVSRTAHGRLVLPYKGRTAVLGKHTAQYMYRLVSVIASLY